MARKRKDDLERSGEDFEDFVPAVFARSAEEAETYRELLNDHDIPAIIGTEDTTGGGRGEAGRAGPRKGITRGVPVLVPEALLDEASEVIADRDYDDLQLEGDEEEDQEEQDGLTPQPAGEEEAGADREADEGFGDADREEDEEDVFEEEENEEFLDEDEDEFDDDLGDEEDGGEDDEPPEEDD